MKKLFAAALALALCLGAAACAAGTPEVEGEPGPLPAAPPAAGGLSPAPQPLLPEEPEPETLWTSPEGVTVSLLQDAYPPGTETLTLLLENQSGLELDCAVGASYEKYLDGRWEPLPAGKAMFMPDVLERVQARSLTALALSVGRPQLAEPLSEGLYRVTGNGLWLGGEMVKDWRVDFRVTADAQPEPDYAVYVSRRPIPAMEGCAVLDRLPVRVINTTGRDAQILMIPHLERKTAAGTWEGVPVLVGFCGVADPLPAGGLEWGEPIQTIWGTLADGEYRLSYQVGGSSDPEEAAYGMFTLYTPEGGGGLPPAGE